MNLTLILFVLGWVALGVILAAILFYVVTRYYEARTDRTFMTHDERGFKRALAGKGVLWDYEESIVKGPTAPKVEFVALDPATGARRNVGLLDPRTGSVNLRPQYCVPRPFSATTMDGHKVIVEARVQFSLNRNLLKYVYQLEDFGLALETRIQSAFRAEIGGRRDEELRSALHDVEAGVVKRLRQGERDGDEEGEEGIALGAVFHTASFTYVEADDPEAAQMVALPAVAVSADGTAAPAPLDRARLAARHPGLLGLNAQQLDKLADVFKGRDSASMDAILSIMEMQTRQQIAEALAASGQLVVLTPQELGLFGAMAQREALARTAGARPSPNGGAAA
ncbi:MAG: hypothetical protein NW206_11670 [Hyphomonadaceae bacterium]|nr:hypothetical protein [Hyphomonadaceae bacterium]